jgi:hypothetical protein
VIILSSRHAEACRQPILLACASPACAIQLVQVSAFHPGHSCSSFYPFYLGEHSRRINRLLHLTGTSIAITIYGRLIAAVVAKILLAAPVAKRADLLKLAIRFGLTRAQVGKWLFLGLVQGYSFAWVGHFFVEKNRPATFKVS